MDPESSDGDRPADGLVERLRRGERGAFDEAYDRYRSLLFSFLVRASRERALAEELLQESWLSLARHARSLEPDTNLRAWLFTVARNLLRSRKRRERFGRELLERLGFATEEAREASPFERAVASETERRVEAAIGRLSPNAREIVLLAVVERLEPAELAVVLDLSPAATRQRLARARAMLAELLAEAPRPPDPVEETP